jgi:hypothetical protein
MGSSTLDWRRMYVDAVLLPPFLLLISNVSPRLLTPSPALVHPRLNTRIQSLCHDWLIDFFERPGTLKMDHLVRPPPSSPFLPPLTLPLPGPNVRRIHPRFQAHPQHPQHLLQHLLLPPPSRPSLPNRNHERPLFRPRTPRSSDLRRRG